MPFRGGGGGANKPVDCAAQVKTRKKFGRLETFQKEVLLGFKESINRSSLRSSHGWWRSLYNEWIDIQSDRPNRLEVLLSSKQTKKWQLGRNGGISVSHNARLRII